MTDVAPIGHNWSPQADLQDLADRFKRLALPLDAESAKLARDLALTAVRTEGRFEAKRRDEQKPFEERLAEIRSWWRPFTEEVAAIKVSIRNALTEFALAEEKRIKEAAVAARRAAEEAEAAAERARVVGAVDKKGPATFLDTLEADDAAKDARFAGLAARLAESEAERGPRIASMEGLAKAAGLRSTWSAEVIDAKALVIALAEHPDVIAAATKVANAQAKSMKAALNLPGVKPRKTRTVV